MKTLHSQRGPVNTAAIPKPAHQQGWLGPSESSRLKEQPGQSELSQDPDL